MSNEKRAALPIFFRWQQMFTLSLYDCMKQIPYEGGHSITHLIFKTCVQQRKDHFSLFLNKVVKEAKMLIELIVVDSNHFIRYKCKITHCLDFQTLSEYISTIVLDANENLSINEVLEFLMGVATFTSTSSFDTQSLQLVVMNELKSCMPGG